MSVLYNAMHVPLQKVPWAWVGPGPDTEVSTWVCSVVMFAVCNLGIHLTDVQVGKHWLFHNSLHKCNFLMFLILKLFFLKSCYSHGSSVCSAAVVHVLVLKSHSLRGVFSENSSGPNSCSGPHLSHSVTILLSRSLQGVSSSYNNLS